MNILLNNVTYDFSTKAGRVKVSFHMYTADNTFLDYGVYINGTYIDETANNPIVERAEFYAAQYFAGRYNYILNPSDL